MKTMTASILALTLATPMLAQSNTTVTPSEDTDTMATESTTADATNGTTLNLTEEADTQMADADTYDGERPDMIRTRDITGADIYSINAEAGDTWDIYASYEGIEDDWNNIGSVEDIVLDTDGKMIGIIAEVGGFLDIGDKHVFIETEGVKLVPVDDMNYTFVTGLSKDELMDRENLDEGFWN